MTMLTIPDYVRIEQALSIVRARRYGGILEGHRVSRSTKAEVKIMLSDPGLDHDRLLNDSLAWLAESVEGLEVYERILGRSYTSDERSRLTKEIEIVSGLPCPVHGCIMCGIEDILRPEVSLEINNALDFLPLGYLRWGFLPALIAAELAPGDLESMVKNGRVADAKISTVSLAGMQEREIVVA